MQGIHFLPKIYRDGLSCGTIYAGYCYQNGIGEKDEYKAFVSYQKSTEIGYATETFQVGCFIGMELELKKMNKRHQSLTKICIGW